MDGTELENLIVRLTGDGTSFQNMLKEAVQKTKQFGQTVAETLASVAELTGAKEALGSFANFETATVQLGAAIKATGRNVESTLKDYGEFVSLMQATSLQSRTSVIGLLGQAEALGMIGEKAKNAVRWASDLEALGRGSASSALAALSVYQRTGNYFALAQFIPTLRRGRGTGGGGEQGKSPAEHNEFVQKEIQRTLGMGSEAQAEMMKTVSGQIKLLQNSLQGLREDLGQIISRYAKPIIQFLTDSVKWVRALNPQYKEMVVAVGAFILVLTTAGPAMRFFSLLMRLTTSISPLSVLFTGLAVATAIWVKSVGGVSEAWQIVQTKVQEVYQLVIGWLGQFIQTHQRLVLGLALIAAGLTGVYTAWRILSGTVALFNFLITTLYIKQLAIAAGQALMRLAVLSYNTALLATSVTLATISGILAGAKFLGALALQAAQITALTVAWLGWKLALFSVYLLLNGAQMVHEVFKNTLLGLQYAVVGVMTITLTATKAVADFFTMLGSFAWGIYTGAISLATLATIAFDAAETVATFGINLLVGAIVLAVAAFGAWELIISPLIALLFGLGSTVMAVGGAILGTASALLGFALSFGAVFVAGFSAAQIAGASFLDVLLAIPAQSGPIAHVGELLSEWFGIFMSVYHAALLLPETIEKVKKEMKGVTTASSGMDLAWEMLVAGFNLAVEEIKSTWPPLFDFLQKIAQSAWDVLQAGWTAFTLNLKVPFLRAWTELVTDIKRQFFQMIYDIVTGLLEASRGSNLANMFGGTDALVKAQTQVTDLLNSARKGYFSTKAHGYAGMAEDAKAAEDAIEKLNLELEWQKGVIDRAAKGFGVVETDEVKKAKARVKELQDLIAKATKQQAADQKKAGDINPAKGFEAGEKEIHKWEAALIGSAEAASRIQEYYEKLSIPGVSGAAEEGTSRKFAPDVREGLPEFVGPPAPSAPGGGGTGGMEAILEKIYVALTDKVGTYERRVRLSGVGKVGL